MVCPKAAGEQKEALDGYRLSDSRAGLFPCVTSFLGEDKRVHLGPREPHMSLRIGSAPDAVVASLPVAPLCKDASLCSSLLLVWLQVGLADHVSPWPLSSGEPLGALHAAVWRLGALVGLG